MSTRMVGCCSSKRFGLFPSERQRAWHSICCGTLSSENCNVYDPAYAVAYFPQGPVKCMSQHMLQHTFLGFLIQTIVLRSLLPHLLYQSLSGPRKTSKG